MPATTTPDRAARLSALKQAMHLVAAHGTPGGGQNAALAWLASEIAHFGGGTVHLCAVCMRPVVVTEPVARQVVKCHRCRKVVRKTAIFAGHRPSTVR